MSAEKFLYTPAPTLSTPDPQRRIKESDQHVVPP